MDITVLMQHPIAGRFYGQIPANSEPGCLAAQFERFIVHGDYQSQCFALAIENHVRQLATIHFQNGSVRDALSKIESALDRTGPYGKNGRKCKVRTLRNRILDSRGRLEL